LVEVFQEIKLCYFTSYNVKGTGNIKRRNVWAVEGGFSIGDALL